MTTTKNNSNTLYLMLCLVKRSCEVRTIKYNGLLNNREMLFSTGCVTN